MYRLDVLRLFIPPLRKRENDALLIFDSFLRECAKTGEQLSSLEPDASVLLARCPFKGNIRELRNIAERAAVLYPGKKITGPEMEKILYPQDVEEETEETSLSWEEPPRAEGKKSRESFAERMGKKQGDHGISERELILWGLKQSGGSQSKAASLLGMDRTTLWRKRKKYGI